MMERMARARGELEEVAYVALQARYARPPRERVAAASAWLRTLSNPHELIARGVLEAQGIEPSSAAVERAAEALREAFPTMTATLDVDAARRGARANVDALEKALEKASENSSSLAVRLSDCEATSRSVQEQCSDLIGQLAAERRHTTEALSDLGNARSVAQRLWASMPAEGKLQVFESDDGWLPHWVRSRQTD